MQRFVRIAVASLTLSSAAILFDGCGTGELPTAVEQPQQLFAHHIAAAEKPVLDGIGNDAVWANASSYRVFIDPNTGGVNVPSSGLLMEFKAVWWEETRIDSTTSDTLEVPYIGFLATWPDPESNIDKHKWSYNASNSTWVQGPGKSDWLIMIWLSAAEGTDIWYWDAATTNPMGYFQDMLLEYYNNVNELIPLFVRVDGLSFFNDTESSQNTWDNNYDDNKTPRDSTDDRPLMAWKNDPNVTTPALPPVYSDAAENMSLLLESDAAALAQTVFSSPTSAASVPGYVLQQPLGGSADIPCYGRHSNGKWTLEFYRSAGGSDNYDVVFNPRARYFSQVFTVGLGYNVPSPFDVDGESLTTDNSVQLTFQFVLEE